MSQNVLKLAHLKREIAMFNYEKLVNRIETGHFCIQLNGEKK